MTPLFLNEHCLGFASMTFSPSLISLQFVAGTVRAAGSQHGNLEAQCWALLPVILAQSCWGTLLTNSVQHRGHRLWQSQPAAGATSWDSKMQPHIETFLFSRGQGGERNNLPLLCVSHARSIKGGNKKAEKPFLWKCCHFCNVIAFTSYTAPLTQKSI